MRLLALNPGFPFRILSRSCEEKSEGKPGRIFHVMRWHRDVSPDADAIRHVECSCCCVFPRAWGKEDARPTQATELPGVWAHCWPSLAQEPTGYFSSHTFAEILIAAWMPRKSLNIKISFCSTHKLLSYSKIYFVMLQPISSDWNSMYKGVQGVQGPYSLQNLSRSSIT